PSVDLERPDLLINVHIRHEECHLSLDSSGESLHKRGWRKEQGEAPLSEVLAAALVSISGWTGEGEFLDPMCGSGTIPIEAAMQALQIPAVKYRRFYAFYKWRDFDRTLWNTVKDEANALIRAESDILIRGCDASWKAIKAAETNVRNAGLEETVRLDKKPFQAVFPRKPSGVIVTNPPYDERIRSHHNAQLYHDFGDVLKQRYHGYTAWVFSGDLNAIKNVGLRPMGKHVLFNGPIECRYVRFELFDGKIEDRKSQQE
ncbi:MAG: methyltransferase, partial [Proteobacteria bacterium]|nr:methyltransferase [Pseudomonadota bacterium]